VALLHYPVCDRNGQVVTTSVTNLDVHDIARSVRTFGLYRYFIVNPAPGQHELVGRLLHHWREGWGADYNSKRRDALGTVRLAWDLSEVRRAMTDDFGMEPLLVVTGARPHKGTLSCCALRSRIEELTSPVVLAFGTGWGLTEEVFGEADFVLDPIIGADDYNHLSVRSAVAIYLDRLFGRQ
jgi:hypothetical protein